MYPLSFLEFLCAREYQILAQALLTCSPQKPMDHAIHQKLLRILGEYFALGGMPEAVASWQERHDTRLCREIHNTLIDTYKQDFNKYAARYQIKYLEALFNAVPRQLGKKFKYSAIEGDYRKRELVPCLELLATAGIVYQIMRSAGNGIPLGAEIDASDFKAILLDVALNQTTLGLNVKEWLLTPETEFINKGALIEAFVGQELLAYAPPSQKASLFYWRRNVTGSEAEIDYLIQDKGHVVPVEVKSGAGSTLKSMRMFLDSHPQSPYGIRFSSNNYSDYGNIHSYPLYAIPCLLTQNQAIDVKTYEALVV
jgi:predicted AAA+ superfamily ATPase